MGAPTMAVTDGGTSFTLPATSVTVSVSDHYCAVHGWVEVRGAMGALVWHLEHDECAP